MFNGGMGNMQGMMKKVQKLQADMAKMQENMQEYFAKILPEQFLEYLECLTTDELLEMQYDQIVVDEGQDIIKPLYLYCLDFQ